MERFQIITRRIFRLAIPSGAACVGAGAAALTIAAMTPAGASSQGHPGVNIRDYRDVSAALSELSVEPEERARRAALAAMLLAYGRADPNVVSGLGVGAAVGAASEHLGLRASPPPLATPHVANAVSVASKLTEVSQRYLWRTARRESGLNPYAAASTSSARGLYQFIEQTWLRTVRAYGARHGLGRYAAAISLSSDGVAVVRDGNLRNAILALRYDPAISARMAAELTSANRRALTRMLGRTPSDSELYAAHLLGVSGAFRLLVAAAEYPRSPAALVLPRAAAANPQLFYMDGAPVTCSQLLQALGHA